MRRNLRKKIVGLFGFLMLAIVSLGALYYVNTTRTSLSSEEADAVFGGEANPFDYPYAGYLLSYSPNGVFENCGMVMISSDIGLSAAHCMLDKDVAYVGLGNFEQSPSQNVSIKTFLLNDEWNGRTSDYDVLYFQIERPFIEEDNFATVDSPTLGCDYEILGYGRTDQEINSPLDQRRSATICIDEISDTLLSIRSPDGGVCFGDSGSPIFRKDTSSVVGVTSAIDRVVASSDLDNCFVGNTAKAVRLDTSVSKFDTFVQNVRQYGALCINSADQSRVQCSASEACVAGQCTPQNDLAYVSELYETNNRFTIGYQQLVYILAAIGILLVAIIFISFRRMVPDDGY